MADKESGFRFFDPYDFSATVVPGAAFLLGVTYLIPRVLPGSIVENASLGELGLFAIAAFCAGHIIQAPANIVEDVVWRFWGRPTERMRHAGKGLSDAQVSAISKQLHDILGLDLDPKKDEDDAKWRPVTAQIVSSLTNLGRTTRLDKFNGNYGLFRGLTAALILLIVVAVVDHNVWFAVACLAAAACTAFRMRRFQRYYARELWLQFLCLTPTEPARNQS